MGQSPSTEAGKANEVNGDGPSPRKQDDNDANRGRGEADLVASQPLPNPRETQAHYTCAIVSAIADFQKRKVQLLKYVVTVTVSCYISLSLITSFYCYSNVFCIYT